MTISQALDRVNQAYTPGVVKYYAQLKPDPWEAAHLELEKIAGVFDPAIVEPACERFVNRCLELIERFKQDGKVSQSTSPADAFAMGGEKRVQAHHSRKQKHCAQCESKEGLRIVRVSPESLDVVLLCAAHAQRRTA